MTKVKELTSKLLSSNLVSSWVSYVKERVHMSITSILKRAGVTVVEQEKVERLQELVETIYVDNRRTRQVEALNEARELVKGL